MICGSQIAAALPVQLAAGRSSQHGLEVESSVEAHLLEQVGAADGGVERRQAERGEQDLEIAGELLEEAGDVLGLAAEFRAQIGPLCGDASRTGVEVTLAGHVAAERYEDGGAEGIFVGSEERGDEYVAGSAEASIAAQADAAAKSIS